MPAPKPIGRPRLPPEARAVKINLTVTPETRVRLAEIAAEERTTISAWVAARAMEWGARRRRAR